MRTMLPLIALLLASCADNPAPCNIAVHTWTPAEQKQMVHDEQTFLPADSILYPVLQDCAAVRSQARQCNR